MQDNEDQNTDRPIKYNTAAIHTLLLSCALSFLAGVTVATFLVLASIAERQ